MTFAQTLGVVAAPAEKLLMKDLIRDFLSMALLIRRGSQAQEVTQFVRSVEQFFTGLEHDARAAGYSVEQVKDTQYALCAFLDESVLRAGESPLRSHFEVHSLQFQYFGVHLAGEGLFEKLTQLREDVKGNRGVLEVYHLCLALGFEGRYSLEQKEQLAYIANSLGQDLAKGQQVPQALSPDWALPDQVSHLLRYEVPMWLYVALLAAGCGIVFWVLRWLLERDVALLAEQLTRLFGV
ncbi:MULTISPECIES: DotU family type IV/VI secretion system protein [unclassified Pseudomonas]|uniref:DotU family type IV/VI secretion system protein n=1 Tax=unclassified Pseudomonas TaxID=196821 RepID=UPI00075465E6|nr:MULTISPECIES: DotU family type IV/VI secretion system protein [unclassified Pseudomonas]KVV10894.1 type IV/VI secretion system protein, DotU family [Pseudomonas sp. TAD18]KVV11443.1 type IV/VI secretion system protein, DotU family [Pseudomonas sp. TAA207]